MLQSRSRVLSTLEVLLLILIGGGVMYHAFMRGELLAPDMSIEYALFVLVLGAGFTWLGVRLLFDDRFWGQDENSQAAYYSLKRYGPVTFSIYLMAHFVVGATLIVIFS